MKLQIKNIGGAGDLKDERLVLKAIDDEEIGQYLIADSTYLGEGLVSNLLRHFFWIPDGEVAKGDLIVIYTKEGTDRKKTNSDGTKTHFFYWGLKRTIWNNDEDRALIFKIDEWRTKQVV